MSSVQRLLTCLSLQGLHGDLLKKVTRKNLHSEISTGEPVGRETW
jgi:hypothetical protein